MQTAIGADFWGGVNFLFWGGRISRDSTKRELIFFFFFFFFVYGTVLRMAGSAENSARKKKEGWCVLFFFFLFPFTFSGACVLSFLKPFWWGKQVPSMQKSTQKFIHSWQEQRPAQMEGVHTAQHSTAEGKARYDTMAWLLQLVYQKHRATAAPAPYLSPDYPVGTCSMQAKAIAHQVSGR